MNWKPIFFLLILLQSCDFRNEEEKILDESYKSFAEKKNSLNSIGVKSDAELILKFSKDSLKVKEVREWLNGYKLQEQTTKLLLDKEKTQDSLNLVRFKKLGGLTALEIDDTKKCNRTMASYLLNKKIKDSSDLAFLAYFMANDIFKTKKSEDGCNYPIMTCVYLYYTEQNFLKQTGDWISMCSKTPSNWNYVSVATWNLKK